MPSLAYLLLALLLQPPRAPRATPPAPHAQRTEARDGYFWGRVSPGARETHRFYIGAERTVVVQAEDSVNIDCVLYQPDGQVASADRDTTNTCVLSAPAVGWHTLLVLNYGGRGTTYHVTYH